MKTKYVALLPLALALMLGMTFVVPVFAGQGNGLPSGAHYTLNILGKNWDNGDYAMNE